MLHEKKLYAIVWALKNLQNYPYGVPNLEIYTDNQPSTFALSPRNPNTKMKDRTYILQSPTYRLQPADKLKESV